MIVTGQRLQDFEPPAKRQALGEQEEDAEAAEEDDQPAADEDAAAEAELEQPEPDAVTLEDGEEPGDRVETAEDRDFIDDADAAPEERYGSDNEEQQYQHDEAEELVVDELDAIFAKGKKKKAVRLVPVNFAASASRRRQPPKSMPCIIWPVQGHSQAVHCKLGNCDYMRHKWRQKTAGAKARSCTVSFDAASKNDA